MSDAPAARLAAFAWTLLIASSALHFLADNEADNDLWVHLFSGRHILAAWAVPRIDDWSYTAAGASWTDHEWLTQVAFAGLFAWGGSTVLWLFKLLVGLLTVWCVWIPVARRTDSPWVRGPVMVLVLAVLARGYAVRPQIVTYLGVAALLAVLDRLEVADGRRPRLAPLVAGTAIAFVLWANAHGAVIVGLGILGLFALSSLVVRWFRPVGSSPFEKGGLRGISSTDPLPKSPLAPLFQRGGPEGLQPGTEFQAWRWLLFATAALAACLNPYGPALFTYILSELRVPHPLTEWQPIHIGDPAHVPFIVLLAALVVTLPFARSLRRQPWRAALVGLVAVMAVRSQRHTPLLALCAAAPLAEQCDGALAWLRSRFAAQLSAAATGAVALGVLAVALVQIGSLAARLERDGARLVYEAGEYPVGAVQFLRARGLAGNLAVPLDWGGYVLWHGAPALKVSLDGRFATVYPPRVVADTFAFFSGAADDAAQRLLSDYPTTLVLAPRGLVTPVQRRPGWRVLYADEVAVLFATGEPARPVTRPAPRGRLAFP